MQARKAGKARSRVPSNHRESTQVLGILSQWHTSWQLLQPLPTVRLSIGQVRNEIKLASHYKIKTKNKIPSAVPSLQLFQQAEGDVCL